MWIDDSNKVDTCMFLFLSVANNFFQWRSHWGGKGGQSATPDSENFAKNREKEGKNQEKSGKKMKNREEKAKIGKVLSLWPSWQIELATLLISFCDLCATCPA